MATSPDYYEVLQVSPNADAEVVQVAHKRLVEKWLSEMRPGDPAAFERVKLLNEACEVLSDPRKRREYDSRRREPVPNGGESEGPSPQSAPKAEHGSAHLSDSEQPRRATPVRPAPKLDHSADRPPEAPARASSDGAATRPPGDSPSASGPDRGRKGTGGRAAWVIFTIGVFLFLAGYGPDLFTRPLFFLAGSLSWVVLFGIPAYVCHRFRTRAGVTAVATLFFLAAGTKVAYRIYEHYVIQPRIEALRAEMETQVRRSEPVTNVVPQDAKTYMENGIGCLERRDYDKAIENFNEVIRLDPSSSMAHFNRGVAWAEKGNYNSAIRDYTEAIRLDPNAYYYGNRGLAWTQKKEFEKAFADYDTAIRLNPMVAVFYSNRGLGRTFQGDYDKAIKDFDEAIRLDPQDGGFFYNRGNAWMGRKDYDKAIRDFDEAIRLDPTESQFYRNRAFAWMDKKDYDKAVEDFNEAIRLDPNNSLAHTGRDIARKRLKYTENPVAWFKDNLKRGLTPKQVGDFAGVADTTYNYPADEYLPEFTSRAPKQGAVVARFLPFDGPGGRLYRVNLLFVRTGNGELLLQDWHYRSPK